MAGMPASSQNPVALHAEHAQAEYAGIHVESCEEAADLAEGLPERPVVAHCCVDGPKWESHEEAEVSQRQTGYERVCKRARGTRDGGRMRGGGGGMGGRPVALSTLCFVCLRKRHAIRVLPTDSQNATKMSSLLLDLCPCSPQIGSVQVDPKHQAVAEATNQESQQVDGGDDGEGGRPVAVVAVEEGKGSGRGGGEEVCF